MVIVACSFDGEGGGFDILKLDIICWAVRHLSYTFYANNNKNTDFSTYLANTEKIDKSFRAKNKYFK